MHTPTRGVRGLSSSAPQYVYRVLFMYCVSLVLMKLRVTLPNRPTFRSGGPITLFNNG
jgi:hypothetical protein